MKTENLDLTMRAYEASLRGSYEDFLALLDDDVKISPAASLPHGGTYRGKAGARQLQREARCGAWAISASKSSSIWRASIQSCS